MKAAPRRRVPRARLVKPGQRSVVWGAAVPLRARLSDGLGAFSERAAAIRSTVVTYTIGLLPVLLAIAFVISVLWAMSFQNAP